MAGDVDVNSGKFTVASTTGDTAVAGATTVDTLDVARRGRNWKIHGGLNTGNTVVAGTLNAGATTVAPELGGGDAVEHAGRGGQRERV